MTAQTLKKSLLNYAICGKLSQKWRNSRISENSNSEFSENSFLENSKDFEPPFKIPNSWEWKKLGEIAKIKGGKRLPAGKKLLEEKTPYPYIRVTDFSINATINETSLKYVTKELYEELKNYRVLGNDLCICIAGSIGKTCIVNENLKDAILTENAVRLEFINDIFQKFIFYFLNTDLFFQQVKNAIRQTAQPKLAIIRLSNFYIPLPPKDEQEFIVNELEKLMKLVDIYEVEFQKLEQSKKELKSLEKSLLNYAICGKLSTNWRNSGISENSNPKFSENSNSEFSENSFLENSKDFEPPFEIPNTWQWAKLRDICEINLGKTPPTNENSFWGNDYPWVSIADLQDKQTITKTAKSISQKSFNEIFSKKIVKKGTLLLSFKLTIGRTSILGFDGFHNEAIASIIPKDENLISQNFLLNFLEIFVTFGEKTTAIKGATLNKEKLKNLYIPLPPKDEQEFIVNELEKLMSLCKEI